MEKTDAQIEEERIKELNEKIKQELRNIIKGNRDYASMICRC